MTDKPQTSRNHFNLTSKNQTSDELRFIQWGVPRPTPDQPDSHINPKRFPFSNEPEEQLGKPITNESGEDGNQYYTEYSQVSAIETGFKKLKTNQIQILKQLKKEYEVLRNSSLDSRVYLNKMTSESESNFDSNSVSQSDAQSSINSKNHHNRQKRTDTKELRLANLEKKQLELMLNNSMKKIEQLLHNEIELKKNILELKSRADSNKLSETQYDLVVRRSKESEEALQRALEEYKKDNETLRAKVKELTLSIGTLEGSLGVKEVQLKKKEEKAKLLEEEVHLERNKYFSLELDLKKLKMEYDILEKSKNQEIFLLNKSRSTNEGLVLNEKNLDIKKLKEELEVKEERYQILLNKLNTYPHPQPTQIQVQQPQRERQEEKEYNKGLEKLMQTLKQEKSQQNNESITLILSKLSELQSKPDHHLLSEINNLRQELQLVKHSNTTKYDHRETVSQYEQRIRELQKIIQEQNIQKIYFMQDLKKLTKDYNSIKREKDDLTKEIKELSSIIDKLEQENRRHRNEIDMIKNVNVDLTESQHQNKNLLVKLQHMNLREIEINNVRDEFNKRIDEFKIREQSYEEEVRITKRQLHEEEFKVFKQHEESELKFKLLKIQHETEVNRLQQELQRLKKAHVLERNELINEKTQLEKKLLDKSKEFQQNNDKVTTSLKDKENSLERVKGDQEAIIKKQQERYVAEISSLVSKIDNLSSANERLLQQSHKYAIIEQQVFELKRLMRMNRRITDTVDHLWQVKQTEYSNINDILSLLK